MCHPVPILLLPLILGAWLLALARWVWVQWQTAERPLGAATQVTVVVLIITAGAMAPVKTAERLLDEGTVQLPRKQLTLAELTDPVGLPQDWRPHWLRIAEGEAAAAAWSQQTIDFPATTMTVRQFVATVEAQTSLRGRFRHCGNGCTVLQGGDCSFGLALSTPR